MRLFFISVFDLLLTFQFSLPIVRRPLLIVSAVLLFQMGNEAAKPESKLDFLEVSRNLYEFINAVNNKYNLYRKPVFRNAIQR